jgi:hypothetical protein
VFQAARHTLFAAPRAPHLTRKWLLHLRLEARSAYQSELMG